MRQPAKICNAWIGARASISMDCNNKQKDVCRALDKNVELYGGVLIKPDNAVHPQYDRPPVIIFPIHDDNPYKHRFTQFEWEELDPRKHARLIRYIYHPRNSTKYARTAEGQLNAQHIWELEVGSRVARTLRDYPERIQLQRAVLTPENAGVSQNMNIYRLVGQFKRTNAVTGTLEPVSFKYFFDPEKVLDIDGNQPTFNFGIPLISNLIAFDNRLYVQRRSGGGYISVLRPQALNQGSIGAVPACIVKRREK